MVVVYLRDATVKLCGTSVHRSEEFTGRVMEIKRHGQQL